MNIEIFKAIRSIVKDVLNITLKFFIFFQVIPIGSGHIRMILKGNKRLTTVFFSSRFSEKLQIQQAGHAFHRFRRRQETVLFRHFLRQRRRRPRRFRQQMAQDQQFLYAFAIGQFQTQHLQYRPMGFGQGRGIRFHILNKLKKRVFLGDEQSRVLVAKADKIHHHGLAAQAIGHIAV